jgi:serine/threonine-protein kinase
VDEDDDEDELESAPTEIMAAARPDEEPATKLGPGTDVGGYVIDGIIGRGGMGVVYSATHPVIGKRAAIKVLRAEVSKSPITLERFVQEARAVNQIGHPNIIDIFAYGALSDGRAYHIMDLLVGESLRKRLRKGPLTASEATSVIDEMASALMAAHERGFVHRDLKPDNVYLVTRDDGWPEVKLLDFGLAKLMPEAGIAPFQTKAGVMLGTPEYMSPEQARGVGVDHRTDIYALGILSFEILAGRRPFPKMGDSVATLQQHAEEVPPSIGDIVTGLPPDLVQLVDTMLAKTPGARPSLAAVRQILKRLKPTLPTHSVAGLLIPQVKKQAAMIVDSVAPSVETIAAAPAAIGRRPSVPPLSQSGLAQPIAISRTSTNPPVNLGGTVMGVGVPINVRPQHASIPPPPVEPAKNTRIWIYFALALALAAGGAVAVVVTH